MTHRIGFLVNPIAGMGGRVGLKGTDGVVERARELGAEPTAHLKAREMLRELRALLTQSERPVAIHWLTCSGRMGAECLRDAGFDDLEILYEAGDGTGEEDTEAAARRFVEAGAELILFCGGDGTARDVCSVTGRATPILGIPAGVKMYSGVFGISSARTAEILLAYLEGRLALAEVDVLDVDEERYRRGEWVMQLYDSARTPYEPALVQSAKALISERTDSEAKEEIAEDLLEAIEAEPDALFLLGPGSTVESIARRLGVAKTLLGIDAIAARRRVGTDLNERQILELLGKYERHRLVLSPIGAQGFVLGRGNQQLSPDVVRRVGPENIVVVATPSKLARTPVLRFDTGDPSLDARLAEKGYVRVVTGYRLRRLAKVEI
jgi:predicted polyphosphate/ATP-dependent NAD kinase